MGDVRQQLKQTVLLLFLQQYCTSWGSWYKYSRLIRGYCMRYRSRKLFCDFQSSVIRIIVRVQYEYCTVPYRRGHIIEPIKTEKVLFYKMKTEKVIWFGLTAK